MDKLNFFLTLQSSAAPRTMPKPATAIEHENSSVLGLHRRNAKQQQKRVTTGLKVDSNASTPFSTRQPILNLSTGAKTPVEDIAMDLSDLEDGEQDTKLEENANAFDNARNTQNALFRPNASQPDPAGVALPKTGEPKSQANH